jgi:hypothetical protein
LLGPDVRFALCSQPGADVVAFGGCYPVCRTDVVHNGRSLSAEQVAALPAATRDAVQKLLRVQLQAATHECVNIGWTGGFLLLCDAVLATLRPDAAAAIQALMLVLQRPCASDTLQLSRTRVRQAEALEAGKRYLEAAAIYRDLATTPGAFHSPPQAWSYLGLALKRAGDWDGAEEAYEAGLTAVASWRPDAAAAAVARCTPAQCVEEARLNLLTMLITHHHLRAGVHQKCAKTQAALERMFEAQRAEASRAGDVEFQYQHGLNSAGQQTHGMVTRPSGRHFALDATVFPQRIVELPAGQLAPISALGPSAKKQLRGGMRATQPKLPSACAHCATLGTSLKKCSACSAAFYCNAACQKGARVRNGGYVSLLAADVGAPFRHDV